jgi:hypothetical protein
VHTRQEETISKPRAICRLGSQHALEQWMKGSVRCRTHRIPSIECWQNPGHRAVVVCGVARGNITIHTKWWLLYDGVGGVGSNLKRLAKCEPELLERGDLTAGSPHSHARMWAVDHIESICCIHLPGVNMQGLRPDEAAVCGNSTPHVGKVRMMCIYSENYEPAADKALLKMAPACASHCFVEVACRPQFWCVEWTGLVPESEWQQRYQQNINKALEDIDAPFTDGQHLAGRAWRYVPLILVQETGQRAWVQVRHASFCESYLPPPFLATFRIWGDSSQTVP